MNCVAIALFLANNQKLAANFGTILMDDPTQSMDRVHKAALAKLISKLSGEKQVVVATQDTEFKELLTTECEEVKEFTFGEWSSDGPSISA
jgi:DNA repair exonuclease SbcCD ATPase subunit